MLSLLAASVLGSTVALQQQQQSLVAPPRCGCRRRCVVAATARQHEASSVASAKRDPLRAFPWDVAAARLGARLGDLAWASLKWLSVPTLLVSSGSELMYALVHGKALVVPLAMLLGIAVAGVVNETASELQQQIGGAGGFPWHLVAVGVLFALVKLPGPSYPGWARVFLPHFANGGLWQACYLGWRYHST